MVGSAPLLRRRPATPPPQTGTPTQRRKATVKLAGAPPRAVVLGFKGSIDFYTWKGIPVARRWPRSPGKTRAPQVAAQYNDFKFITQGFKTIAASVVEALNGMASGTQVINKDVAVQLFYGYAIEEENGPFP